MFTQVRQHAIRKIVREHRRLSFAELQARIEVSPATLRRDLADLERTGEIIRVHGGVLDPGYVRSEASLEQKLLRHSAAKQAIAARAAALVPEGASVFVDAGSTCLEAGKRLLGRRDLQIITHSVALVAASLHGEARFLCVGGELRRVSGALVGGAALGGLSALRADFALIGASGLHAEGCSTTEVSEAEMKRAFIERSTHRILLADASKWPQPSTLNFAPWAVFDDWVTDRAVPAGDAEIFRQAGVMVRVT